MKSGKGALSTRSSSLSLSRIFIRVQSDSKRRKSVGNTAVINGRGGSQSNTWTSFSEILKAEAK
jgi:hypothetical protein